MTYTLVQAGTVAVQASGNGPLSVTCASTTAGNLLVLGVSVAIGATSPSLPAGWIQAADFAGSAAHAALWYYPNCPSGVTSAAVTITGSPANPWAAQIMEFHDSAGANTSPLDVTGTSSDGTTPTTLATSSATTAANDLAVAAFAGFYASATKDTLAQGAGFTQAGQYGTALKQAVHAGFDYKLDTGATGTQTDSITYTGPFSSAASVIATFRVFDPAPPALTVIQSARPVHLTSLTGPVTVTLPNPTAAVASTLVACCGSNGTVTANPQVTAITLGGSADHWAKAVQLRSSTKNDAEIWSDPGCASGQTAVAVTWAGGGGTGDLWVAVYEVAGTLTADQVTTAENTGTTWTSGATATTTQANEIFSATGMFAGSQTPAVTGAGTWTAQSSPVSAALVQTSGYQNVSAAGTATFSGTLGTSANYTVAEATFYIAAAAPPAPPQLLTARGPLTGSLAPGTPATYT